MVEPSKTVDHLHIKLPFLFKWTFSVVSNLPFNFSSLLPLMLNILFELLHFEITLNVQLTVILSLFKSQKYRRIIPSGFIVEFVLSLVMPVCFPTFSVFGHLVFVQLSY